jgi:hypothetical protein
MDGSQMIRVFLLMHLQIFAHLYQIVQFPVQGVDHLHLSLDWTWVQEGADGQYLLLYQEEPVHLVVMNEIVSAHTAKPLQHLLWMMIWIACSLCQLAMMAAQL